MTSKLYAEMQDRFLSGSGIVEGSYIRLTGVSEAGAMGWQGAWNDYDYDMSYIIDACAEGTGNEFKVINIDTYQGLSIEDLETGVELNVPFFCVESIDKPSLMRVEMSCGTVVTITQDGFNVDDSYDFNNEDLEKFIEAYETLKTH